MQSKIKILSVVGPTASGKTKLAVELAKKYDGEIISADSMQIYKEMQIATAKPTEEEKCGIPHYLMDFLSPDSTYSVARFVDDARVCISDIALRGKLPIVAGGTGLYVDSLLNHISFNDEKRDETISSQLWDIYDSEGVDKLIEILDEFDSDSAQRLRTERNPKRIIRAIEFYKTTGITITEQIKNSRTEKSPYEVIKLGLNFRDREKLYERINRRVDLMLEQGLIEETNRVLSSPLSFTSVKAIGYKELASFVRGEKKLDECVEKLKRETRRYAKRQITWFKRDKEINWLYVDEFSSFGELFSQAVKITDKGLSNG